MKTINAIGRKLKGKLQQAQGEFQQQSGQGVKGGIQKVILHGRRFTLPVASLVYKQLDR